MTSDASIVTLLEQRYEAALTEGDDRAAFAVVDDAVDARVPGPQIHTDVIAPALVRIGELWEQEALTVADEHLASERRRCGTSSSVQRGAGRARADARRDLRPPHVGSAVEWSARLPRPGPSIPPRPASSRSCRGCGSCACR